MVGCPYEGLIAPKAVAMVRFKSGKKHLAIVTLLINLIIIFTLGYLDNQLDTYSCLEPRASLFQNVACDT